MLRLISIGDSKPMNFLVDPGSIFYPGQMAQLKVIGDTMVCGLSNGTAPFGIIDDINNINDSTVTSGRITVWLQRGIFETDQYDTARCYVKGDKLYCNENGQFTTSNQYNLCSSVAIVVRKPSPENSTLELIWGTGPTETQMAEEQPECESYKQESVFEALEIKIQAIVDGCCVFSGPGRGDCENFIGLPGKSIPGQHDGDDDTFDCYGKPNGWCSPCWQGRKITELEKLLRKIQENQK